MQHSHSQRSARHASSIELLATSDRNLLKHHRVPVGSSSPVEEGWIVSIDEESFPIFEREAVQIQNYANYLISRLYARFKRELSQGDFPSVEGCNTVVMRKGSRPHRRDDMWFWRRISWDPGAYMPTGRIEDLPPKTLLETLDIMSEASPKPWVKWKAYYPQIFQLH